MTITYSIKGKTVETKTFRFQLKSINEDEGTVTGHLSTFGNIDLQKDRVIKGAFKKTLSDAYSRKKNGRKFLIPDLWMHDPNQPTGGVIEATEDNEGLLVTMQYDITTNSAGIPNNPIATMVFSGHKMGYIDELSMGYVALQKEFDGGIRNLKEVQLIECSAVTMLFAANPEALIPASGVKTMDMEQKAVCGNTSGTIGPRDESWDGARAKREIWAVAEKADGSIDTALTKKYFMNCDGDDQEKGSYGYPFWYVGDDPHISVGAVKAIAGAISGARGASAPDGLKSKVETLYKRINSKYPDDEQLTPPWSDDGKRRTMDGQRKDFNDLFQSAQAADCLEDWADLVNTLTQTMMQIFCMGDSPQSDMATCLEQFAVAVNIWLEKGVEYDLAGYLSDSGYGNANVPQVPYSLRAGPTSYMTRRNLPPGKVGATISGATQGTLEAHQAEMKASLDTIQSHCNTMQQKVSDLTQLWQDEGQGDAYTNDKSHVTRREPPTALTRKAFAQPLLSTVDDDAVAELAALLG